MHRPLRLLWGWFRNGIYGLGVADGVYMWKTQGIDSGVFSRTLMEAARATVEAGEVDVLKGAAPENPLRTLDFNDPAAF